MHREGLKGQEAAFFDMSIKKKIIMKIKLYSLLILNKYKKKYKKIKAQKTVYSVQNFIPQIPIVSDRGIQGISKGSHIKWCVKVRDW